MSEPQAPEVRPGQVWEDTDPRHAGRTIRVDALISKGTDGVLTHAVCTVLTVSRNVGRSQVGNKTRPIALSRFRPYNRGYQLVESG